MAVEVKDSSITIDMVTEPVITHVASLAMFKENYENN